MNLLLKVGQIIIAAVLVFLILIQSKGVGLSSTFGGGGEVYFARRGAEKIVFVMTIVTAFAFISFSILNVWLN